MSDRIPALNDSSAHPAAERRDRLPNLDVHLEPERLLKRHAGAMRTALMAWIDVAQLRAHGPDHENVSRALEAHPPAPVLSAVASTLRAALSLEPDRRAIRAAVAVMFDARARGPQNPEIYLSALTFDLIDEGIPTCAVVAGCQKLRREATFTPEIAEVLTACKAKAETFRSLVSMADRLLVSRAELERRLNLPGGAR